MAPAAQLLIAVPWFTAFLWIPGPFKVLSMISFCSIQWGLFLLLCIFVTDSLDLCVDRYYSLFIDKHIWSSEFNRLVKEEQALKSRCPDSKVYHSPYMCFTLTMCQALADMRDLVLITQRRNQCRAVQSVVSGPLEHLHTCGFQGSTYGSECLGVRLGKWHV